MICECTTSKWTSNTCNLLIRIKSISVVDYPKHRTDRTCEHGSLAKRDRIRDDCQCASKNTAYEEVSIERLGRVIPAPRPAIARPTINAVLFGATPQMRDPISKRKTTIMKSHFRLNV